MTPVSPEQTEAAGSVVQEQSELRWGWALLPGLLDSKACALNFVVSAIRRTLLAAINSALSVRPSKFQSGKSFFQ